MAIVIPINANLMCVLCVLSRRAFACANVHDMFNWLSAFILLITEVLTGRLPERRKNGQTTDPTRMLVSSDYIILYSVHPGYRGKNEKFTSWTVDQTFLVNIKECRTRPEVKNVKLCGRQENQRVETCRVYSIWLHAMEARRRLIKRVTNFPYFLHREFGGFTARKLLD